MRLSIAVALIISGACTAGAEPLKFNSIDAPMHVYDGGWEHFVGGGVAAFDCDGDHRPELYVAGGENKAQLLRNRSTDDLDFRAGTPDALALTGVIGAYPLDIDGDANMDLAVLRVGHDVLLKGDGSCGFTSFDNLNFQTADTWTTAFSATWEQGQSLPTLAFGTYVDRADPNGPFEACDDARLYRPDGEKYRTIEKLTPSYCTLSMLFSDWNKNGRADLRVSNDRHYYVKNGSEQMWAMEDVPRQFDADDGWLRYSIWGMGIASRDVTGDGFSDIYLTSMGDQKFQIFDGSVNGPTWRDATYDFGTTAHRPHVGDDGRPSTGWHAQFGDVNNDGRDDIFVAKGNVEQMPDAAMQDPNTLLLQNADGQFSEHSVEAGVAGMHRSRGAALVDLNLDGKLDLVVVNRRAPLEIYQNASTAGNWLLVDVKISDHNSQGVGSFIEVQYSGGTQTREITVGGGHAGGSAGLHHFGVGADMNAKMRVIWPDGEKGPWQTVATNQVITLAR